MKLVALRNRIREGTWRSLLGEVERKNAVRKINAVKSCIEKKCFGFRGAASDSFLHSVFGVLGAAPGAVPGAAPDAAPGAVPSAL